MKRAIAIALCGVLLTGNIVCQQQEGAKLATPVKDSSDLSAKLAAIEKAVEAMRQTENVPGVALVIVKDDSVILQKGFGLRKRVSRNVIRRSQDVSGSLWAWAVH